MNFVEKVYLSLLIGLVFLIGAGFLYSNNYKSDLESTYGIKLVRYESHLLSPNRVIIERDGQNLRCDTPSKDEMKNKTPMTCDDTLKVSPKE